MQRWMIFLIVAVIPSLAATAQAPDLSGTWKLNKALSYFGGEHPVADYQLTKIIAAKDHGITITDIQLHQARMNIPVPDSKITMELTPDGKQYQGHVNGIMPNMPPVPVLLSSEWQGGTLVIQQCGKSSASAMTIHLRYYLSSDGSQLIEQVQSQKLFGDLQQRIVYDRTR